MSFDVSAAAYGRFMGQYSEPLAPLFADWSQLQPHYRALDVGCGTGALTEQLARRLGTGAVAAVDPSPSFVEATTRRVPGLDVRLAGAEHLPFGDGEFDAALAQLVVHFMADPVAGLREMARVTRSGGLVTACVWDHAGDRGPLATFWRAVHDLDPTAAGEAKLAGTREGHLAELFSVAGLHSIESSALSVTRHFASFDEWWHPYTLGVGPAGAYVSGLTDGRREALRMRCAASVPTAPFEVSALAWCARGVVPE
ncbi:class I SAM-dependent methyltransferase [Glaciihabitans sp. INWT7]|uniref:class I SAM-dependent methyltransferase n=1 Tax=Glaciihabitans sp. INWT7 TaxID=2596912 RepID=UPI00162537E7|nr:class I SAM-dependent methyltransferase [Glaciihabitans sp. INWT7]QNE46283.1 class I SAM-dependent methyltransferase [Glaciihabitans sp. INWT7]